MGGAFVNDDSLPFSFPFLPCSIGSEPAGQNILFKDFTMPPFFFRIFTQRQDPHTFYYIGGPKPLECPYCRHQWFFDPVVEDGFLSVVCKKCERTVGMLSMFMANFASS